MLTEKQKKRALDLLAQEDHMRQFTLVARHIGSTRKELDETFQLDSEFRASVEEIDLLWAEQMELESFKAAKIAEGTAQERLQHLAASFPEKYNQKIKLEHEFTEPNPQLIEMIKDSIAKRLKTQKSGLKKGLS